MSILDSGYWVQCPLSGPGRAAEAKHPIGGRRMKIDTNRATVVSRCLCIGAEPHWDDCLICPNFYFKVAVEPIGRPEDFVWLVSLVKDLNKTFKAQFVPNGRYKGDCCPKHQGVVVCRFLVDYGNKSDREVKEYLTKKVISSIEDMIKSYAETSPCRLLHLSWLGYYFQLGLEMK